MNHSDKICYDFKENIINIFNNEQSIPFLLKYYLMKQIWEQIDNHRQEIEIEYNQINASKQNELSNVVQEEEKEEEQQS